LEVKVIKQGLAAFAGKRVLMLQGPLGPFFRRLGQDLRAAGAEVVKIDFNGGDWLFSERGSLRFGGGIDEWKEYLETVLKQRQVDVVLLFGDCRPLHRIAHEVAESRGIEIGVFEEGYVRPDYITLERFGVNAHSQISRDPAFFMTCQPGDVPPTRHVGNTFWHAVIWALAYYVASAVLFPWFQNYRHHRPLNLAEGWPWLRSVWRKQYFRWRERGMQRKLAGEWAGEYFLVALQVHNDAQIHTHSAFSSVEAFIEAVLLSFVHHAPAASRLVIKHHPMDRGYHDYAGLIRRLARSHRVTPRVHYIHDQHLPTLLEHARGVVLVNSTVGLSALDHGTPLKVCGAAIFDLPGLSYQGELDQFWSEAAAHAPQRELYRRFRNYLIVNTQLNGSFYRRLRIPGSNAGLVWCASAKEMTASSIARTKQVRVDKIEGTTYS
jgi:capsular polysaccharide export protein